MKEPVFLRAYAKLNLTLAVTGRRADGYHLLDTVMQSVSLCDRLTARKRDTGVRLACAHPAVPADERNTVVRAANAFFAAAGISGGVDFALEKRVPFEAGLGSASADAAAALAALSKLYGEPFSPEELRSLALSVGADVPFCLTGGTKRAQGIGEFLSEAPPLQKGAFVVMKPSAGISTPQAYRAVDEAAAALPHPNADEMTAALLSGELDRIGALCENDFLLCCPLREPARLVSALRRMGALGASMTGSGSAVFGLFADEAAAYRAAAALRGEASFCEVALPVRHGVFFEIA